MSFPDKGAVADIDPAFYIGFLHRQRATGTLKFDLSPVQRAVYFKEGRILFSSSNASEDQLGAILVAAGKIRQEQFDSIVASLEPKQSIAAALAQGGHVSQRDIGDAARRKVEQIVAACCAQAHGQYNFDNGLLPKGALDLKLTTEKILVSAFELLEPSGFLNRILKSPMAVLAASTEEIVDPELVSVRDALDGVSSLADIGGTVGLPLAATEARAAALVVLGGASVVTSQIEEMSLPDTGEQPDASFAPGLSEQTPGFETSETVAFMPGNQAGEPGGVAGGADMAMALPSTDTGGATDGSEATLVMGSGLDLAIPPGEENHDAASSAAKRPKASTQDLAAVKELIGATTGASMPRPPAAAIPSQRWEPKLSSAGRTTGRESSGPRDWLTRPAVQGGLVLAVLAVVGVTAWSYFTSRGGASAPTAPVPQMAGSPSPVVPPGPAAPALPAPTTQPVAAAPPPSPPVIPKPAAAVPAPTAAPSPTKPRPEPPAARPPLGAAFEDLKSGRLQEAQAAFLNQAQARASDFSVQLLVACAPATIEKALQNDPSPEVFILPATISGKSCHRLMRGFFKTQPEAVEALSALPPYYRAEGAKPQAVALKSVLR